VIEILTPSESEADENVCTWLPYYHHKLMDLCCESNVYTRSDKKRIQKSHLADDCPAGSMESKPQVLVIGSIKAANIRVAETRIGYELEV